jgi:hypothetical protein
MKAIAIILNILAVLLNIFVLGIGICFIVIAVSGIAVSGVPFKSLQAIIWFKFNHKMILFFNLNFVLCSLISLYVLMNKYSFLDKWIIRFLGKRLSKRRLALGLISIGAGLCYIIYHTYLAVTLHMEKVRLFWLFVIHIAFVYIAVLGLLIAFKNKRLKLNDENQLTDS